MRDRKVYDLEERTFLFALNVRLFIKSLPRTISNIEDGRQLVRASGSVGANYIEANEKTGAKDLVFRLKLSRKEAKESHYWLRLLKETNEFNNERIIDSLMEEAIQLKKILSSIISKCE